ncbi:MAG: nitrate/nitrite transporter NrtS [Dehalococcoidia bacterium]
MGTSTAARICAAGHPSRSLFRFASGPTPVEKCLRHSMTHRPLAKTALRTALVVGTVLTAINQGNTVVSGTLPAELAWKIPLTYCVPYLVSTLAALRISLVRG